MSEQEQQFPSGEQGQEQQQEPVLTLAPRFQGVLYQGDEIVTRFQVREQRWRAESDILGGVDCWTCSHAKIDVLYAIVPLEEGGEPDAE